MFKLFVQKNPSVPVSPAQLFREACCSVFGHQFHVPSSGAYPGLSQSHCYRCGAPHPVCYTGDDWVDPR